MNPFDEIFDTQSAIDYLNNHGKKIARITLVKNYAHLGQLLNPRLRIYFKRELDAFLADEDYTPDPAYEQTILNQIIPSTEASQILDINRASLTRIMAKGTITYHKIGGMAFFTQQWLDDYRENTKVGRPPKDKSS